MKIGPQSVEAFSSNNDPPRVLSQTLSYLTLPVGQNIVVAEELGVSALIRELSVCITAGYTASLQANALTASTRLRPNRIQRERFCPHRLQEARRVLLRKECLPHTYPIPSPSLGRGARLRRLRRQLYRQWRQTVKGTTPPIAPDNALVKGKLSLKAVKRYRQTGVRTARMFKHLILRKDREEGKQLQQKPCLTTPPIPYSTPIRVGTQNAQSMAELLKHQAVLMLMRLRSLDILFLTETHATSYHQFKSEHHLFVVNGNKKDKYAGVTAVVHPRILPFLKEINQHSNRILQLTFAFCYGLRRPTLLWSVCAT